MNKSESIDKLAAALAKAQGEFPEIEKKSTVKVATKSGGTYEFHYADLSEIINKTKKALSSNELSFCQDQFFTAIPNGMIIGVETTLMHSSGQWLATRVEIPEKYSTMQTLGSALTYARRYCLNLALGVSSEEDTDANDIDPRTKNFSKDGKSSSQGNQPSQQRNSNPPANNQQLDLISEPQVKRLWAMSSENKISDNDMKSLLKGFGFDSSKKITKNKYDKICQAIVEMARKREVEMHQDQLNEQGGNFTTEDIPF